jgi:hypothetical protein
VGRVIEADKRRNIQFSGYKADEYDFAPSVVAALPMH